MAVVISNIQQNSRCISFVATGDGSTTTFTVGHNRIVGPGSTMTVKGMQTSPTGWSDELAFGGLLAPTGGTGVAISSHTHTAQHPSATGVNGILSITTTSAIGAATKAYFVVTFDQYTND